MDLKLKNNNQLTSDNFGKIDYIESSGIQSIDTGAGIYFSPGSNFKVDGVIEVLECNTSNGYIYRAYNSSVTSAHMFLRCDGTSTTSFYACYGATSGEVNVTFSGKTHIVHQAGKFYINDVLYSINNANVAKSADIILLGNSNIKIRIWYLKVYNTTGVLTKDYIPAISHEYGHEGEAALYDKVSGTYRYSSANGTFTASSSDLYNVVTTAYIKDCPNVSGVDILRKCNNLSRVRCDVGSASGSIRDLINWSSLSGFNDNYEEQIKPRIIGTYTISDYYTLPQVQDLTDSFNGLTIEYDPNKNIDTLFENDEIAVQTLDSTKANYNPAVGIILANNKFGAVVYTGNSKGWIMTKTQASAFTNTNLGTIFRGKVSVTDTNNIVDSSTSTYNFNSFNEFKYFTGVTTITAGSSTSSSSFGAFGGCTNLTSIEIPNSVTTIGAYAFYNDTSLSVIKTTTSITSVGTRAFYNCSSITNLDLSNVTVTNSAFGNTGSGTGTLIVKSWGRTTDNPSSAFKNIIILNSVNITATSGYGIITPQKSSNKAIQTVSFLGNLNTEIIMVLGGGNTAEGNLRFVRLIGTGSGSGSLARDAILSSNGCIIHLMYDAVTNDAVPCTPTFIKADNSRVTKVYVGDGSSSTHDTAIKQKYLDDTNWASYSSKLDLYYNYHGQYRTYTVTDNLTNCTNSNPVTLPYITRGNSYSTVIIADEGYTIDSVTVTMYEAVDDGATPTDPTDITNDVYDSSTGEINIASVTGNISITASAIANS